MIRLPSLRFATTEWLTKLLLYQSRTIDVERPLPIQHSSHSSQFSKFGTYPLILISFLLLAALAFILFFYRLGDRDLWSSHEGRAAQDAESILEDGHWGLPRLFDRKYVDLQKPPLYYWMVASIAFVRGEPVDAWAVRLPSALAALGSVILLFCFGIYRGRIRAALTAAIILATAVHFTWLARIGRIDMPLTLANSLSLICFYFGWKFQKSWPWLLPAYLAVALAVLLKGPIGLVLSGIVVAAWLLSERELPPPWRIRSWWMLAHRLGLWWGLPLILVIAGPWFLWAGFQTDGALEQSLWYHNVVRAVGGTEKMRARPVLFYIPRLGVDFLPWSVLLPFAVWYLIRRHRWRLDPEARFGLVWLVSMMAVLSCVGFKRADYLLPAYPGAALFLGCVVERWLVAVRHPLRLAGALAGVVAACLVGWGIYLDRILPQAEAEREDRTFAAAIRRYAPPPDPVIFFSRGGACIGIPHWPAVRYAPRMGKSGFLGRTASAFLRRHGPRKCPRMAGPSTSRLSGTRHWKCGVGRRKT